MKLKSLVPFLQLAYFLCSFFACMTFAGWAAVAFVEARHVSHFEGGSGYAAMFQMPLWFVLFLLLAWLAFIPLRRHTLILGLLTLIFAGFAVPFFVFVASFF